MDISIINYINAAYNPHTVIVYGSCVDGGGSPDSDFDAVIISDTAGSTHDGSVVGGAELDLFVYNTREVGCLLADCDRLTRIYGGVIVVDRKGIGAQLMRNVNEYVERSRIHEESEKLRLSEWCEKILRRAEADGEEALYLRRRLATDSLEIYFIMRDMYFYSPRRALLWLRENNPAHLALYSAALSDRENGLGEWIEAATLKENTLLKENVIV